MKKTLGKLLRRNVFFNFKQFLSIIIIIFLSMTLFSGFIVNSTTLEGAVTNYFEDTNLADLWVYAKNVEIEDEEFFQDNEIEYEKRLEIGATVNIKNQTAQNNAKIFVYDTGKISTPYIFNKAEGCWIDQKVAKNNNIKVGQDRIVFDYSLNVETSQGIEEINLNFEFLITGTMTLSECADIYSSWPILIDKNVFLTELNNVVNAENLGVMADMIPGFEEVPYNEILVKCDNVQKTKNLIENYYSQKQNSNLVMIFSQDMVESVVMLRSEVEQSKKMIYIFPTIFLLVAVLVMITSISQLILQEKTKIGTLKSLGATNKILLKHYSSYGAVLCIIGALAGLIVGSLVIPEVMFVKYDLVYSLPKDYVNLEFPWLILITLLIVFVIIGYMTAYFTCHDMVKKKPADCLKSDIKINLKSKNKKNKLPLSVKMAFRNLKIKPIRMIMAMIGVAGCTALMLCGYGIGDTLKNSLDNDLERVFSYDVSSTYLEDDFLKKIDEINEVSYYEKYETFVCDVSGKTQTKTINVYKIEPNSKFVGFGLKAGEVAVSMSIADEIGAGESIKVVSGGEIAELKISKVVETSLFNGVYVCGEMINVNFATRGVWIDTDSNAEELAAKLNEINGTNSAQTKEQIREYAENKISSISVMTTTLKVFAVALAVVVLLNLVFLILKERIKEIATLKVLGQNLWTIVLSLSLEILLICLVGMTLGMFLGYPMLVLVLIVNKVEVINFIYFLSPLSFVLSALVITVLVVIISVFSALKIKKINMTGALKINE